MNKSLFCVWFLPLLTVFGSAALLMSDEEPKPNEIAKWIKQLGDSSFLVRQRSESFLIRVGLFAYPELQRAKQSDDLEIARRAEKILNKIELSLLNQEDPAVGYLVRQYMVGNVPAIQTQVIWRLADPFSDISDGKGLMSLCRIARFDANPALRLEAVKTLIASPPDQLSLRLRWYRHIRNTFAKNVGDDEAIKTLCDFAAIRCETLEGEKKTDEEFRNKVKTTAAAVLNLLQRPESGISPGSRIDILIHYAAAELQDYAGLTEDRDTTAAAALTVQSASDATGNNLPLSTILNDSGGPMPMREHLYAGLWLKQNYRLNWAMAHFQRVIAEGHILLKSRACEQATETALLLADYPAAVSFCDKRIQIVGDSAYSRTAGDTPTVLADTRRKKSYCEAEIEAEKGDWKAVHKRTAEYLEQVFNHFEVGGKGATYRERLLEVNWHPKQGKQQIVAQMMDDDWIILACRAHRAAPEEDDDLYVPRLHQIIWSVWNTIGEIPANERRHEPSVATLNRGAWMLANTETANGYFWAAAMAERALRIRPDDPSLLDTQAHVYFFGKKYDEAIKTQEKAVRIAPEVVVFQKALDRFKKERK